MISVFFQYGQTDKIEDHPAWAILDEFDCGESVADRIIGGKNAALGQFPWITRLGYQVDDGLDWMCGGVLISDRHVVTAAHCVDFGDYDIELVKVRMGEYDSRQDPDCDDNTCAPPVQDREPKNITVHPSFQDPPFHNDIAVIELNEPVDLNDYVVPICLPREAEHRANLVEGDLITVAGWGKTNVTTDERAQTLQVLSIPVVPPDHCNTFGAQFHVAETELCAGAQKDKDACGGDSGGPAMQVKDTLDGPKTYLIGVVSFGPTQCGINKPGVYVSVPKFVMWILDTII